MSAERKIKIEIKYNRELPAKRSTKERDKLPARLQQMLLKLQRYNIKLHYKPGKELYTADNLSRAHLPKSNKKDEDFALYVHQVISHPPFSDKKLTKL